MTLSQLRDFLHVVREAESIDEAWSFGDERLDLWDIAEETDLFDLLEAVMAHGKDMASAIGADCPHCRDKVIALELFRTAFTMGVMAERHQRGCGELGKMMKGRKKTNG